MKKRLEQVNELIKQEVGEIILREVPIPLEFLVTISHVVTTPNLKEARIFLTVFPSDKTAGVLKILKKNIGRIQFLLNKKLMMRPLPRISFKIDEIEKRAERIEAILDELERKGA